MVARLNTAMFIARSKEKHPGKYTYEKTEYVGSQQKVIVTCPTHGDFLTRPALHINDRAAQKASGCPTCGAEKAGRYPNTDTESFIKRAREVHGMAYLYDKVNSTHSTDKVIITCRLHGDFPQLASSHLSGAGCRVCAHESIGERNSHSTESYVKKCQERWGDKRYDYSKVQYRRGSDKLTFGCPEHGEFTMTGYSFLNAKISPCKHCNREERLEKERKDKSK